MSSRNWELNKGKIPLFLFFTMKEKKCINCIYFNYLMTNITEGICINQITKNHKTRFDNICKNYKERIKKEEEQKWQN